MVGIDAQPGARSTNAVLDQSPSSSEASQCLPSSRLLSQSRGGEVELCGGAKKWVEEERDPAASSKASQNTIQPAIFAVVAAFEAFSGGQDGRRGQQWERDSYKRGLSGHGSSRPLRASKLSSPSAQRVDGDRTRKIYSS